MKNKGYLYRAVILLACAITLAFIMGSPKMDTVRYTCLAIAAQAVFLVLSLACLILFYIKNK